MLSGLPPLVRDGDQFSAMLTLRNTTAREMKMRVTLAGSASADAAARTCGPAAPIALPPQEIAIAGRRRQGGGWPVSVPADVVGIGWEATRRGNRQCECDRARQGSDEGEAARLDAPSPFACCRRRCRNSTARSRVPVAAPGDALPPTGIKRGGLDVGVQPRLTGALPGLRRYFETYPFTCLEQMASKAIGLRDAQALGDGRQRPAHLPRRRRPRQLLSAARRRQGQRQRSPHRLPARCVARVRLRAARRRARPDALRARRVRRRPHRAQILVAAAGPRRAQDRRHRSPLPLRPRAGEDARLREPHAEPLADGRGDRLAQHPASRRRHSRAGEAAGRGPADPAEPPHLRRHDAEIQHRGRRLLVVADGQRRRQRGATHPRRAGRSRAGATTCRAWSWAASAVSATARGRRRRPTCGARSRSTSSRRSSSRRRSPARPPRALRPRAPPAARSIGPRTRTAAC